MSERKCSQLLECLQQLEQIAKTISDTQTKTAPSTYSSFLSFILISIVGLLVYFTFSTVRRHWRLLAYVPCRFAAPMIIVFSIAERLFGCIPPHRLNEDDVPLVEVVSQTCPEVAEANAPIMSDRALRLSGPESCVTDSDPEYGECIESDSATD